MAKKPTNTPTGLGQRVKLRGRPAYGEIVAWYPPEGIRKTDWCTVAWDWECYIIDPPIKGLAWGISSPNELEII